MDTPSKLPLPFWRSRLNTGKWKKLKQKARQNSKTPSSHNSKPFDTATRFYKPQSSSHFPCLAPFFVPVPLFSRPHQSTLKLVLFCYCSSTRQGTNLSTWALRYDVIHSSSNWPSETLVNKRIANLIAMCRLKDPPHWQAGLLAFEPNRHLHSPEDLQTLPFNQKRKCGCMLVASMKFLQAFERLKGITKLLRLPQKQEGQLQPPPLTAQK